MSTYLAECKIADFVKSKIQNSKKLDIDYTKYKNIDNFTMSDSQLNALKVFAKVILVFWQALAAEGRQQL